jgi:hypothetical protein
LLLALWWPLLLILWGVAPQRLVALHERLPDSKILDQAAEAADKLTAGLAKGAANNRQCGTIAPRNQRKGPECE